MLRDAVSISIRSLAIPPAWTEVWICPVEEGHLQAVGRDARKRKQYRYHPRWRQVRDETKFDRMADFAKVLPSLGFDAAQTVVEVASAPDWINQGFDSICCAWAIKGG